MFSSSTILCAVIAVVTANSDFCWKDSYLRSGKVPKTCHPHQDRIGLLCYDKCPGGYKRFGFDCHSICPSGFRDDGLFCRDPEYGRGAGYPWKFGDPFNDENQWKRCEQDNPQGCEKHLLIVYPKCDRRYKPFGCCICRPEQPDCPALGLEPGIDLSCAKKIIIGKPHIGTCPSHLELNAGLCYEKCKHGYQGIAFVCWSDPPSNWVNCGLGAARTSNICAKITIGQVFKVGHFALNIATGFSTRGLSVLKAPADSGKLAKLKQAYNSIKNNEKFQKYVAHYKNANEFKEGYVSVEDAMKATTNEEMIHAAVTLASVIDPTGAADVIAEYIHPPCSKIRE